MSQALIITIYFCHLVWTVGQVLRAEGRRQPGKRVRAWTTPLLDLARWATVACCVWRVLNRESFNLLITGAGVLALIAVTLAKRRVINCLQPFWSRHIEIRPGQRLVTHGPYALVRHPHYALNLVELAVLPVIGNVWAAEACAAAFAVIAYGIRIPAEERALAEVFGEEFRSYQAAVPCILPWSHRLWGSASVKREEERMAIGNIEQLIGQLRAEPSKAPALFQSLGKVPAIDHVRRLLRPEDKQWIWKLVDGPTEECASLGLRLLRPFAAEEQTQSRLRDKWNSASVPTQFGILFRLLDDPNLPEDWHQKLLRLVVDHQVEFRAACLHFYGSQDVILKHVIQQLGDPTVPENKKWIYFCLIATCLEDKDTAVAFVRMGTLMRSPLTRTACDTLLDRKIV